MYTAQLNQNEKKLQEKKTQDESNERSREREDWRSVSNSNGRKRISLL